MNIEATICRLRALEPEDLELMYGWENDMQIWRVSGTVAPFSRHVLSRLIEEQQFDIYATRQMRLVIEHDGQAVGAVDLFEFDPHNRPKRQMCPLWSARCKTPTRYFVTLRN